MENIYNKLTDYKTANKKEKTRIINFIARYVVEDRHFIGYLEKALINLLVVLKIPR